MTFDDRRQRSNEANTYSQQREYKIHSPSTKRNLEILIKTKYIFVRSRLLPVTDYSYGTLHHCIMEWIPPMNTEQTVTHFRSEECFSEMKTPSRSRVVLRNCPPVLKCKRIGFIRLPILSCIHHSCLLLLWRRIPPLYCTRIRIRERENLCKPQAPFTSSFRETVHKSYNTHHH